MAPPVESFSRVQQLQQLDHPASAVVRPCRQVPTSLASGLPPAGLYNDTGQGRGWAAGNGAGNGIGSAGLPRGGRGDRSGAAGRNGFEDARDDPLGRLSDLAYGYRVTPRGLARRAASAGAMYPIELVWLTHRDGRWALRYFDPLRQGCVDIGRPGARCAAALGLRPGQHAVLLIAVAWRTVQRYGVRGYRYCLLDAGHVLGNLAAVAAAAGARPWLPDDVPQELLCAELDLPRDELLLGVAVLDADPDAELSAVPHEQPHPDLTAPAASGPAVSSPTAVGSAAVDLAAVNPAMLGPAALGPAALSSTVLGSTVLGSAVVGPMVFGTEQPPLLAPAMERIRRLHAKAAPASQLPLDLPGLLDSGRDGGLPGAVADVLRRRSARSFVDAELAPADGAALAAYLHRVAGSAPLAVRLVTRSGERWSCRRWDLPGGAGHGPDAAADTVQPCPAELASMFGDQPIAATAAAFAVLGMPADPVGPPADPPAGPAGPPGELREPPGAGPGRPRAGGDLAAYRQALLCAGIACAGGYLLAARRELATTVLGGFDDRRVSELAGGGIVPLVVQAFGPGETGRDVKNDTVAATWLRP
jgi:nitroreductase